MDILTYDGSFNGLLCVIFEKYERKLQKVKVVVADNHNFTVFGSSFDVITDPKKAERVYLGLQKKLSAPNLFKFYKCYLSELVGVEETLIGFASYVFDNPHINVEKNFGNKYVLEVEQLSRKVEREKHRFEAFVRFKELKDGLFYAVIRPDFNILPLITNHFKKRYADQKWLIYDLKRNYGMLSDTQTVFPVASELKDPHSTAKEELILEESEKQFQRLWSTYFSSVNIVSRKNTKLHLQHLPKRYWQYLPEKKPLFL